MNLTEDKLLELLEVYEVTEHFLRREMVEQSQHPLKQEAVLATAQLLRNDDSSMGTLGRLPLLVERSEIANVETEDGAAFVRGEDELFLVRGGVFACLLSGQDIETTGAQIDSQPGHDMAVEIETQE